MSKKNKSVKSKLSTPLKSTLHPAHDEISLFLNWESSIEDSILLLLGRSFSSVYANPEFNSQLREIKKYFVLRDYVSIFTNPTYLAIYTAEYIPGRALCYQNLFLSNDVLRKLIREDGGYVLSLGSGAGSELVGISSALVGSKVHISHTNESDASPPSTPHLTIHSQDLADYSTVLTQLESEVRSTFKFPHTLLQCESSIGDILSPETSGQLISLIQKSDLITCMFLLNELFASSKSAVVKLITTLVRTMKKDSLLLVVDSAGSFSNINVGGQEREYKIYMILDQLKDFEIIEKDDSRWYRFPETNEALNYPTKLNNMRYFIRLYRKI
ncbi:hypothetical protein HK098_003195 [Nowakowskiella sp. JEL0407]|nr:hypothetical protein HK098_003195 [Nowakowskiella sp. JEL0407]